MNWRNPHTCTRAGRQGHGEAARYLDSPTLRCFREEFAQLVKNDFKKGAPLPRRPWAGTFTIPNLGKGIECRKGCQGPHLMGPAGVAWEYRVDSEQVLFADRIAVGDGEWLMVPAIEENLKVKLRRQNRANSQEREDATRGKRGNYGYTGKVSGTPEDIVYQRHSGGCHPRRVALSRDRERRSWRTPVGCTSPSESNTSKTAESYANGALSRGLPLLRQSKSIGHRPRGMGRERDPSGLSMRYPVDSTRNTAKQRRLQHRAQGHHNSQ